MMCIHSKVVLVRSTMPLFSNSGGFTIKHTVHRVDEGGKGKGKKRG